MNKTKRRIFKTAIKLFAEKGFDNAGIEEITAVSGVAKGSLYYHFETKEEIFDTLLDSGFKLLENSVEIKCRHRETAREKLDALVKDTAAKVSIDKPKAKTKSKKGPEL